MLRRFLISLVLLVAAATSQAGDDSDPLALIASIYRSYTADTQQPGFPDLYSRRLQALIDEDAKNTPEGDAGKIDWDLFVDGNNWELTKLKITLVSRSARRAQVQASFDNFKKPRRIIFDLVRERSGWHIDDIGSALKGSRWTMSKILTGAPDAFPDAKK